MVLLYKELIQKYESDYKIKKLIQEGKIFKIEKGIYSDKKNVNYIIYPYNIPISVDN